MASGEKAEMNGVANLSVLDGWWVEGYRKGAGWALPEKRTYQNQEYQDKLDAATIYSLLENEITPLFFNKTKGKTYSADWVKVVKNSIATIAPHYTMKRQLDDYYSKFYDKQAERSAKLHANDNRLAKEIALWKETVAERWDSINVVDSNFDALNNAVTGKVTTLTFTIDEQGLQDAVGLELVVLNNTPVDDVNIHKVLPFKLVKTEGNLYTFQLDFDASDAGAFKCAVRMYPKNSLLPHRQDFAYVKWLN